MNRALWIIGAALVGWLAFRSFGMLKQISPEDFVYYYAGTRTYWAGENPYDRETYQARLKPLLGGENRFPSKDHPWLYPPAMAWLFAPFSQAAANPKNAFIAWSILLGLSSLLLLGLLGRLGEGPARLLLPAVLLACPAADNAFWTHRVLWITIAAFVGGVALIQQNRQKTGGAVLALLGVQPQWWLVAAACLAAGRRWKALAVTAGLNAVVYAAYFVGLRPFSELSRYVSNIGDVGSGVLFSGNLSLAAGLYRLGIFASGRPVSGTLEPGLIYAILWWASVAAFAAGMFWLWRSRMDWEEKALLTVAFTVWIQPYTHGSEALWLIPGFLIALKLAFADKLPYAALGAIAGTGLMRLVLDAPGWRGHVGSVYLLATIALLVVARRRNVVALTSAY